MMATNIQKDYALLACLEWFRAGHIQYTMPVAGQEDACERLRQLCAAALDYPSESDLERLKQQWLHEST
jgi:hypothetical protein